MTDTKISAATNTTPPLTTDMLPLARVGDTTARRVTVGNVNGGITVVDPAAIQASINATPVGGVLVFPPGSYHITTQLEVNSPMEIRVHGCTFYVDCAGYAFHITSPGVSIIGAGGNTPTGVAASTGSVFIITNVSPSVAGCIQSVDANRTNIIGLTLDLGGFESKKGYHQLGGWYCTVKNIYLNRTNDGNTGAYGIMVESTTAGSGSTGAYVSQYENIFSTRIYMKGVAANQVTTITLVNVDAIAVIVDHALSITFIQPVLQNASGGNLFTLSNINGLTVLGGDFEGNCVIYQLGAAVSGIVSIGNSTAGWAGDYIVGGPPGTNSIFMDAVGENRFTGNLPRLSFQNPGWAMKHYQGIYYDGGIIHLGANLTPVSATQGTLHDVTNGGVLISISAYGAWTVQTATAGANPRTLTTILAGTGSSIGFYGVAPVARQTGIAVTPAAIHAALVNLGLIAA